MLFRHMKVGDTFDFVSPIYAFNSFYLRCVKTGARTYTDERGTKHNVGSINAKVYHVHAKEEDIRW